MTGNLTQAFRAYDPTLDDVVGLHFRTPRCWRALFAVSGREQKAADWLREWHIHAYWPNYCVMEVVGRNGNGRIVRGWRCKALIPGFIFIAVRVGSAFNLGDLVGDTPGVVGYMRNGLGEPATITEHDITRIREIEGDHNRPTPAKHVHNFRTGQKVRFKVDPVLRGKILAYCADGRISIEVEKLLGGATVKAWPHQLEAM